MRAMITMAVVLCAGAAAADDAGPRAGVTYRFEADKLTGTVWAAGRDARRETIAAADGHLPYVEISKDGGRQVLVVEDEDRVYYDQVAYRARSRGKSRAVALPAASVAHPFEVVNAKVLQLDVRTWPAEGGCLPVKIDFAYLLQLGVSRIPEAMFPARVEGVDELCLAEGLPVADLPFGHGLGLVTGIETVDKAFTEAVATLRGVPVRRKASVTRQIQGGESVTSTLVIHEVARTDIAAHRFEVPAGYRYREPVIVEPVRQ